MCHAGDVAMNIISTMQGRIIIVKKTPAVRNSVTETLCRQWQWPFKVDGGWGVGAARGCQRRRELCKAGCGSLLRLTIVGSPFTLGGRLLLCLYICTESDLQYPLMCSVLIS